jgi:hypothetical protein
MWPTGIFSAEGHCVCALTPDLALSTNPRWERPAPSATRSPRDPTAMPTPLRAIPWADLLAAPFTAKSKVRNI